MRSLEAGQALHSPGLLVLPQLRQLAVLQDEAPEEPQEGAASLRSLSQRDG